MVVVSLFYGLTRVAILGRHLYCFKLFKRIWPILFLYSAAQEHQMSKLDLEWLSVFVEIYKTSSVSRAAERLGMAQAAASIALNKLRAHYDDRLFTRTARGMLPTPRAESLYPDIREVVERLALARSRVPVFVPTEAERTFTLCMTDISEVVLLPGLLNYLKEYAPRLKVKVEKISPDSPRRLEDGLVDLAVGFMPQLEAGFFQQVLFEQHFICIASVRHPRVKETLSPAAYLEEKHVMVATSGTGHVIVDTVLARLDVTRHTALEVPSFLGVARIVAETELLATVPLRFGEVMQGREGIALFDLPFDVPPYEVKQHWHERFHDDAANIWLRRVVANLLNTHARNIEQTSQYKETQ